MCVDIACLRRLVERLPNHTANIEYRVIIQILKQIRRTKNKMYNSIPTAKKGKLHIPNMDLGQHKNLNHNLLELMVILTTFTTNF